LHITKTLVKDCAKESEEHKDTAEIQETDEFKEFTKLINTEDTKVLLSLEKQKKVDKNNDHLIAPLVAYIMEDREQKELNFHHNKANK
jgi:hypothetical protein